jgi:hypothetical protein
MKNINKTINTINLGYINKDEILKKNNSEINNKSNLNFSQFTEKNNKKEEKKKKSKSNENETEKTLKTTKTNKTNNIEISNNLNPSFKFFSKNGIQRKNTLYLEKLRKITHKPNLYDSLDDEELEDEDDGTIIYLDPNSNFVLLFDGILFLVFSLFIYMLKNSSVKPILFFLKSKTKLFSSLMDKIFLFSL